MANGSNVGNWELWGPLRQRYESRAQAGGPYRLLALDDLVPREADGQPTPKGLGALGLGRLDAAAVSKLDSIDSIDGLLDIGAAVTGQIDLAHFGRFVRA